MYTVYNDELYHYGVLGMKWGRRKAQKQIDNVYKKRVENYGLKKKKDKAEQKGDSERANKLRAKINKNKAKATESKKKAMSILEKTENGKAAAEKVFKEMSVYSPVRAAYKKAEHVVIGIGAGAVGAALLGTSVKVIMDMKKNG